MAAGGAAMIMAGAGIKAYGQYRQGKEEQNMAEYNAAVERENAKYAVESAAYEENRRRDEINRMKSKMAAVIGASGTTMEGSPLELMIETEFQGRLDIAAIRRTGSIQAARHRSQAELDIYYGKVAKRQWYYRAGSSLLMGGGQAYSSGSYGSSRTKTAGS
jgi:hypothetical protein